MITPEDLHARVLYKDTDTLVLDKPAGLAVHAGPKGGVTLDTFLPELTFGAPDLPQLAHRLDRDTTGCLVLGRNRAALARLGQLFAKGHAQKLYCAVLCGVLPQTRGEIDLNLARRSQDKRSWWMKVDPAGENALTYYQVLDSQAGFSFVALWPKTGRTHQLRVHCAALDAPIAGDSIYGGARASVAARQVQLHARAITLPGMGAPNRGAPETGAPETGPQTMRGLNRRGPEAKGHAHPRAALAVAAPIPAPMLALLAGLGLSASGLETDDKAQAAFASPLMPERGR